MLVFWGGPIALPEHRTFAFQDWKGLRQNESGLLPNLIGLLPGVNPTVVYYDSLKWILLGLCLGQRTFALRKGLLPDTAGLYLNEEVPGVHRTWARLNWAFAGSNSQVFRLYAFEDFLP